MYFLKVYSIHYTLRQNTNFKIISSGQNKRYKKCPLFSFTTASHHCFNFNLQGSNYLFRSDPQRFREKFQQLEGMGESCKPPIASLGPNAIQIQENSVQFNNIWSKI